MTPATLAAVSGLSLAALLASAQAVDAQAALETLARTRAEPVLVEAVAFDADGRLLVSSVHQAGIYRLGDNGRLRRFGPEDVTAGVFGIVADRDRGVLWAASSDTPYDRVDRPGATLLKYDLDSGQLLASYSAPDAGHTFGDLALGPDGTVFVSDPAAGRVLALRPGSYVFETIAELGERGSAQGLAVSPDGAWLIVADYGSGLHRIGLATGERTAVSGPESAELRGLDGLTLRGSTLIAIQNGTATPRVLSLSLSADGRQVTAVETLVEGSPLSEPTTGTLAGAGFVFVSRSQWTDFDREGAPRSEEPEPAVISLIRLPPS